MCDKITHVGLLISHARDLQKGNVAQLRACGQSRIRVSTATLTAMPRTETKTIGTWADLSIFWPEDENLEENITKIQHLSFSFGDFDKKRRTILLVLADYEKLQVVKNLGSIPIQ